MTEKTSFGIYKEIVTTQTTNKGETLAEAGTKKARWFRKDEIQPALDQHPELFTGVSDSEKLQDAVFVHHAVWGRDSNVLLHNQIIGNIARKMRDELGKDAFDFELASLLHDVAECHLDDVCDVVSGRKTEIQKEFKNKTTIRVFELAGFSDSKIDKLFQIVSKKGVLGSLLKQVELTQFYHTALNTEKRLKKLDGIFYRNVNGNYKPIPSELQKFWIEYSLPIIAEVKANQSRRD